MHPLKIEGVVKSFGGRRALDGASLELREREVLGLLGPNGAGKSTLVRTIMGRVRPDSGRLLLFGSEAAPGDSKAREQVGFVPQEIALYPLLTSYENLSVFGEYLGLSGRALDDAIARALEWAALSDRAGEPVKNFSGGMKRRLNMAAGVLNNPRILLLDEPTVGVDPQSRERIYTMIEALRERGVSIVYTTHYMEEAERLCDRIAVIDHGKIIATGTKHELVEATIGAQRSIVIETESGEKVARLADTPEEMLRLVREMESRGDKVRDLSMKTPSLEQVFLHLTGRELRE